MASKIAPEELGERQHESVVSPYLLFGNPINTRFDAVALGVPCRAFWLGMARVKPRPYIPAMRRPVLHTRAFRPTQEAKEF